MTLRALIVFLAVLNLGIAAWWLLRPDAVPTAVEDAPSGVARLQLVSERIGGRPMPSPAIAQPSSTPEAVAESQPPSPTTAPERCYSLGPFVDAKALIAAQASLQSTALRVRPRTVSHADGRGWRVFLPAAADRTAADANAARLRTAGFSDLMIVADGAEANSIALGRFTGEARARQHAEALRVAGFEARVEPLGEARSEGWVDIAVAADFDLAAGRRASGAARSQTIDCAGMR
jgi:hypothetical protein